MAWFLLLLALAALVLVFFTTSLALGVCCMLASLVLALLATVMALASRSNAATRRSR